MCMCLLMFISLSLHIFFRFWGANGWRISVLGKFQQEVEEGSIQLAMFLYFHYQEVVILLILLDLTSLV